jgi:hypothetical protein
VSRKTQLLGKADALQFAGRSLRNLGEKEYFARHLEVRQTYCGEFPQVFLAGLGTFSQNDDSGDILAQLVVGD